MKFKRWTTESLDTVSRLV